LQHSNVKNVCLANVPRLATIPPIFAMNATVAINLSAAYSDHSQPLLRYCQRHTKCKEDAEEVVQDTFLNYYNYLERGSTVLNVRSFLFQVATNLLVDWARRRRREREQLLSLDALQEKGFELPQERSKTAETAMDIDRLLEKAGVNPLSENTLLLLRYKQGLPLTDIAKKMGISRNAVAVRLHRALKNLRLASKDFTAKSKATSTKSVIRMSK